MKAHKTQNLITSDGIPRGDWVKIVGNNLARWNVERETENGKRNKEN